MPAFAAPSLAWLLAVVFAALAALHLYWGCGGTWAGADALPQHPDGRPVFRPGVIACFVVAAGLSAFGAVALAHAGIVPWPFPAVSPRTLLRVIATIFTLRAVGDFRYVGITRRVRGTRFAEKDRAVFTPLCFGLGIALWVLAAI